MTVVNFDNRFNVHGTYEVRKNSDNSLFTSGSLDRVVGWFGTNDSFSHPYPYSTGGPWDLVRTRADEGLISGELNPYTVGYRKIWNRYLISSAIANGVNATLSGSTTVNDVLARSNPSRASVDLPYFFLELRELPELIVHIGKNNLRNTARANLTSEFGWETLVSDLKSLLDFQSAVDRKASYLSNAYRRGGIHVRGDLRKGSYRNAAVTVNASSPLLTTTTVKYAGASEWCTVTWMPDEDVRNGIPTLNEIRRRAFLAVIGNRASAHLVWNLLPWTWLIDWFVHVGSYLQAKQNSLGFHPGVAYVMTHNIRGTDHSATTVPNFKGTYEAPVYIRETKSRRATIASTLSASVPILTGEQIGILASLAVLKLL